MSWFLREGFAEIYAGVELGDAREQEREQEKDGFNFEV